MQSHSVPAGKDRGLVLLQLEKLTSKSPPLADLDALELYDEALQEVLPDSLLGWARIIGEQWLLRVKVNPTDEEGNSESFRQCLLHEDYDHAQQIANNLEKNFPNNHAYHLWTITTLFYYSQSTKYDEAARHMRGRLAFALITRLAAETKKNQVSETAQTERNNI